VAVAQMAQPNAEPVEEYEYVLLQDPHFRRPKLPAQIANKLLATKDFLPIFP